MNNAMRLFAGALALVSLVLAAAAGPAAADSGTQKARRLVGTWSVRNETTDPNYAGNASTGQVTFSEDQTFTIDAGGLAAAGLVHASVVPSICNRPLNPISFKFLGTGAKQKLYVSWTAAQRKAPHAVGTQNAVIDLIKLNGKEAILVGEGGCGGVEAPRISHLTRVDAQQLAGGHLRVGESWCPRSGLTDQIPFDRRFLRRVASPGLRPRRSFDDAYELAGGGDVTASSLLDVEFDGAQAATLCVNPGGTGGCFASVQSAIPAAAAGDLVDVAAGTYAEPIVIGSPKRLTSRGAAVAPCDAGTYEAP